MTTQEKLRPIATKILYEDDEVRVWDQVINEGETLEQFLLRLNRLVQS